MTFAMFYIYECAVVLNETLGEPMYDLLSVHWAVAVLPLNICFGI